MRKAKWKKPNGLILSNKIVTTMSICITKYSGCKWNILKTNYIYQFSIVENNDLSLLIIVFKEVSLVRRTKFVP